MCSVQLSVLNYFLTAVSQPNLLAVIPSVIETLRGWGQCGTVPHHCTSALGVSYCDYNNDLTVDLLEKELLAAEKSIVAVGACRGDPRTPFFEGCSPSPLLPSVASAAAVGYLGAEGVGGASAPSGRRKGGKGKGSRGGGGGRGGGGSGGGGVGGGDGGGGSGAGGE
ncbi:unnamed protein product [Closterium sp. NIES-54]